MLEYTEIKNVDSLLRQESKVDVPVCCLYFVFAMLPYLIYIIQLDFCFYLMAQIYEYFPKLASILGIYL